LTNILMIVCDQLRQDALGCYGNPVIRTPHIDRLAADGVRFDNAFCTSPLCIPARISMLTGRYPHTFAGPLGSVGHRTAPHISQILKDAGYDTAALGKMHFIPCTHTYGFDTLALSEDTDGNRFYLDHYQHYLAEKGLFEWPHGVDNWDIVWADTTIEEKDYVTTWNGDRAVDYLTAGRDKHKPFFCVCSFPKPHPPFDPPQPYNTLYDPEDMPSPKGCAPIETRARAVQAWHDAWEYEICMRPELRNKTAAYYYGAISLIDKQIGRIIAALKDEGVYDETAIVFLADHGEQLGDQRLYMKHFGYDASVRIPMLYKAPGISPGAYGGFVNQTDLMPTFCGLAGCEMPPAAAGMDLSGMAGGVIVPRTEIVCGCTFGGGWFSIQNEQWKYIHYANGGDEELYAMACGTEDTNLAGVPEYSAIQRRMKTALEAQTGKALDINPYNGSMFGHVRTRAMAHRVAKHLR
jgi:arylsulfatase A-like enzyme